MKRLLNLMNVMLILSFYTICVPNEPEPPEVTDIMIETPDNPWDIDENDITMIETLDVQWPILDEEIREDVKKILEQLKPILAEEGIVLDLDLIGVDDVNNPQYAMVVSEHDISPTVMEWSDGYYIGAFIIFPPRPPFPPFPMPPFPWPLKFSDEGLPLLLKLTYTGEKVNDVGDLNTKDWEMEIVDSNRDILATIPVEFSLKEHTEYVAISWLPKKIVIHLNILGTIGWDIEK